MWSAIAIFLLAYVAIASGKLHKTIAALGGACLVIALRGVSKQTAYLYVDLNVIFLLLGMMVLAHVMAETGFFQWAAIYLAKKAGGNPITILLYLLVATAVLSAFLDNVTTVVLMGPVTILLADELELVPTPFLIMEALASNVGGAATLIGDPPNILIGSRAELSFNDFLIHLAPVSCLCVGVMALVAWLLFRRRFHVPEDVRARVRESDPSGAITDRRDLARAGTIMGLVLVGFVLHDTLGVQPSVVALLGALAAVVATRKDVREAFAAVEWSTLMFFAGLFILVGGLEENGVLAWVAAHTVKITRGHFLMTVLFVLWGSAAASAIVDNIPFVAAMIPVIAALAPQLGGDMGLADPAVIEKVVARPLWWALALGACLGGNGTLVGASANVVIAGLAERHGRPISFGRFTLYGAPTVVITLIICSIYIYVRYFLFNPVPHH